MRNTFITLLIVAAVCLAAYAGDITGTGMSQADLYTFFGNVVTMCNELKSDHNASLATDASMLAEIKTHCNADRTYTASYVVMLNELKTDFNDISAKIGSLTLLANALKSSVEGATTTVSVVAATTTLPVIAAADASQTTAAITGTASSTGATVSTTNLTLTGL